MFHPAMLRTLCLALGLAMSSLPAAAHDEALFKQRDLNGDGVIDHAEHRASDDREFQAMDSNGDGQVTVAEYAGWLGREMGFPVEVGRSVAACFVRHVDTNRNGRLSQEEIRRLNDAIFFSLAGEDQLLTWDESRKTPPAHVLPALRCG